MVTPWSENLGKLNRELNPSLQDAAMNEELETWKRKVEELRRQLESSRSDYAALEKRMEEQQTQVALQRSHMKKQLADQRKRSMTIRS